MDKNLIQNFEIQNDWQSIKISFSGVPLKEDIDYESKKNFLIKLLNKNVCLFSINNTIKYIRTVLRDFDEKELKIELITEEYWDIVEFKNKKIKSFNRKIVDKDNLITYNFRFDKVSGVNISVFPKFGKICSVNFLTNNKENIKEETNNFYSLICNIEKTNPQYLHNNDKILLEIYKLFFHKNPNLLDSNTIIKLHSMVGILNYFGICLPDDDITIPYSNSHSVSVQTNYITNRILPYNDSFDLIESIKLKEEYKNEISAISFMINEFLGKYDDNIKILEIISQIVYVKERCVSSDATIEDIMKNRYVTCNNKELVSDILNLTEEIKKILYSDEEMKKILNLLGTETKQNNEIKIKKKTYN